jgi:hypothetical protein
MVQSAAGLRCSVVGACSPASLEASRHREMLYTAATITAATPATCFVSNFMCIRYNVGESNKTNTTVSDSETLPGVRRIGSASASQNRSQPVRRTVYRSPIRQAGPNSIHTAGYKRVSTVGTPGCRISSRSYSRQYQFCRWSVSFSRKWSTWWASSSTSERISCKRSAVPRSPSCWASTASSRSVVASVS